VGVAHDVEKPAAEQGFWFLTKLTLQPPETRPPTQLGHRVFRCSKSYGLGLGLRLPDAQTVPSYELTCEGHGASERC
jgi:hypothetical protein